MIIGMAASTGVASALQLGVPSYALRLVRRFGAARVGWFLVVAFLSLATLHMLEPWKPVMFGLSSGMPLDLVYTVCSVLLIIGMTHMEALFSERERSRTKEDDLRAEIQLQARQENADAVRANRALLEEIVRREQREKRSWIPRRSSGSCSWTIPRRCGFLICARAGS